MEIWKIIPEDSRYEVSNLGRLRSNCFGRTKILKLSPTSTGYLMTTFGQIHRTVAKAFIPNPLNKEQVNHIDGNKSNNCVDNLEWVSSYENIKHAITTGLRKDGKGRNNPNYGKPSPTRIPVYAKELLSGNYYEFLCIQDASTFFNIKPCSISNVISGRRNKVNNIIFGKLNNG